ncbi:MAG: amidohydrolase [Roseiflexaceae bacterium]
MTEIILCAPLYSKSTGFVDDGAIAIRRNKIIGVGHRSQIASYATTTTVIKRYPADALLIPGFCDSHQHFLSYIRGRVERLSLWDVHSLSDLFAKVVTKASTLPVGTWIIADGHDQGRYTEQRHPSLAELDTITPHHPLFIHRACHHIAIANSAAMAIAGITADTPHPEGGRIAKDIDGQPNGILEESARTLVSKHIILPSIDWQKHIPPAVREYHKRGITAIGEAAIGHINGLADLNAMQDARVNGRLPLRVSYMGYGTVADAWLNEQHLIAENDWQNAPIIKYFVDGTLGGETAWLSQPYKNNATTCGYSLYLNKTLCHVVQKAHLAQYQVAIHAIGDAAVAQVLDAYAAVLQSHPRHDHRHRIEHVEVLHAGLAQRFADLGVLAAVQPLFTWYEESDVAQVPDQLLPYTHAWKELVTHQVPLAFGSDNPVVPDFTPVKGIAAAVTRHNHRGIAINPSQALSWQSAINAYTATAAWSLRREHVYGDLQKGMKADFVVLNRQLTASDIDSISVLETWLDGKCVYQC